MRSFSRAAVVSSESPSDDTFRSLADLDGLARGADRRSDLAACFTAPSIGIRRTLARWSPRKRGSEEKEGESSLQKRRSPPPGPVRRTDGPHSSEARVYPFPLAHLLGPWPQKQKSPSRIASKGLRFVRTA